MGKISNKTSKLSNKKTSKKNISNAEKYEKQKKLTAERVKKFRANMTEEQWEEKRKKDRERYRKKKEENLIKPISELSNREQRKKRKAWKVNSRKYRAKKKMENQVLDNTPPHSEDENSVPDRVEESNQKKKGRKYIKKDRSKAYRKIKKQEHQINELKRQLAKYRQRLHRNIIKSKPVQSPSPNTKVKTLVGREKISPQVKKRLFLGYALEKQLISQRSTISPKSKEARIAQKVIGSKVLNKYRVQRYFTKIVSYKQNRYHKNNYNLDYKRKPYLCKSAKLKRKLIEFFQDDTVSKMCPGKRDFKKKGKKKKQRRILLDSLLNLHKRFVTESGCAISYSTFSRARPFWVTHPTAKDRNTCACIIHSNLDLVIAGLNSVKAIQVRSGKEALNTIVCSVENKNCMTGLCNVCKDNFVVFNPNIPDNVNVKYYQWKNLKEKKVIKGKLKEVKRMLKVKVVEQLCFLKKKLNVMMIKFKSHIFHMLHQAKHKKYIKGNLRGRDLMFMLDFSENYCSKYESEVQAMHFGASKRQITLHTVVLYYNNGEKIVPHSFCTVSDNLAHQSYAVWAHLHPVLEIVSKQFPQTECVHFFSDSPSSQYRNRNNLYLLKENMPNYFPFLKYFMWNYSEPGHGKGAMDGVGGALKRRADELVAHGCDITCASDIVESFQDSKVTVIEVSNQSIERMKKKLPNNIAPVPRIMTMKQIACNVDQNTMYGRSLSCSQCLPTKDVDCSHYKMGSIFSEKKVELRPAKKRKLAVEEVWSSDEDGENQQNLSSTSNQTLKPGTSNSNTLPVPSVLEETLPSPSFLEESPKVGTYVLIRYTQKTRKGLQTHQFVGVCQNEEDGMSEIKVMFLKNVENDMSLFFVNEQDIAFITKDQIVAILAQPNIVLKGNRVYYKFNYPINTF